MYLDYGRWALVKDEGVYQRMSQYITLAEMGLSREAQLRALSLMKTILKGNGAAIFEFAHQKMQYRWQKLSETISLSKRFTLQEISPQFCNFFEKIRDPSPGDSQSHPDLYTAPDITLSQEPYKFALV